MKTREQERMALALEQVRGVAGSEHKNDYGRACLSFTPLVRSAGFAQAVAFFGSRKEGHKIYISHLAQHLQRAHLIVEGDKLLDAASKPDVTGYMLLTREALACALWQKRLAQSELDIDPTVEER